MDQLRSLAAARHEEGRSLMDEADRSASAIVGTAEAQAKTLAAKESKRFMAEARKDAKRCQQSASAKVAALSKAGEYAGPQC